jgi:Fe-S-cluster containining protein
MDLIVKDYGVFLSRTSELFRAAAKKHRVKCKRGCFECCSSGFFDITLLDALHLRAAIENIPAPVRERILARAHEQLDILEKKKAFSRRNPLLKSLADIDRVSRRSAKVACPALENGACMIYDHRPHICRIFGPTVRGPRRAVRLEGCGYFTRDLPETDFPILSNYADEGLLLKALFSEAGRKRIREVDTIIPAALTMDLTKWL